MSEDHEENHDGDPSNQIFGVCPICAREGDREKKRLFRCEYCGEFFCEKHKEPTLIMSFQKYQELSKDPKIGHIIEKEWRKGGHPCIKYSEMFWEKLREEEEKYYQALSTLLDTTKKPRKTVEGMTTTEKEVITEEASKIYRTGRKKKAHGQNRLYILSSLASHLRSFGFRVRRSILRLSRLLSGCMSTFWKVFVITVVFLVAVYVFVGTGNFDPIFILKRGAQVGALLYLLCILTRISSSVRDLVDFVKGVLPWAVILLVVFKPGLIIGGVAYIANIDENVIEYKLNELNISPAKLESIVSSVSDVTTEYPSLTGDFYEYGGRTISRSYNFLYRGKICKITVNIPSELYEEARNTEKHAVTWCYGGVCSDVNWTKYWISLTLSPAEKPIIMNIVNQLRACAENDNEFVEAAALFVQSIDYDWNKFFTPLAEGTRFPVETLVEGRGVCGDKALLLAAILHYAGFETALLEYKQENHMAVGVKCTCPNIGEYCFIEPTQPSPIGYIPKEYVGGVKLVSFPTVHRLPKSEGKHYTCSKTGGAALSEIKQDIIDVLRREFSLTYRPELDSAITRNVLPYGYTGGLTWTFELPKGSPSFVIAKFYRCYIQDRCGFVSTNSGFVQDARTSRYFGVAVYDNGTEYTVKILLAD